MYKAVPAFTIQHYISHTLLINFNYWSVSKTAEISASRPEQHRRISVSRPRRRSRGRQDCLLQCPMPMALAIFTSFSDAWPDGQSTATLFI